MIVQQFCIKFNENLLQNCENLNIHIMLPLDHIMFPPKHIYDLILTYHYHVMIPCDHLIINFPLLLTYFNQMGSKFDYEFES